MAKIGFVAIGNVSHMVCSTAGPLKAYCGTDLYPEGKAILYVGRVDRTEVCPTCISKEKQDDDGCLSEYARSIKGLTNEDLLEEVYMNVSALSSDTCNAQQYDSSERELEVSKTELNARLTACGFLRKKEA